MRDAGVHGTNCKGGPFPVGKSATQKTQVLGILSAKGFHWLYVYDGQKIVRGTLYNFI